MCVCLIYIHDLCKVARLVIGPKLRSRDGASGRCICRSDNYLNQQNFHESCETLRSTSPPRALQMYTTHTLLTVLDHMTGCGRWQRSRVIAGNSIAYRRRCFVNVAQQPTSGLQRNSDALQPEIPTNARWRQDVCPTYSSMINHDEQVLLTYFDFYN